MRAARRPRTTGHSRDLLWICCDVGRLTALLSKVCIPLVQPLVKCLFSAVGCTRHVHHQGSRQSAAASAFRSSARGSAATASCPPTRSAGGYRLYDGEAIDRLRAMRRLIDSGWSAQQAAERGLGPLGQSDLDATATEAETNRVDAGPRVGVDDADAPRPRRHDGRRPRRRSTQRHSTRPSTRRMPSTRFEVVIDRIVMPAMREIGAAWEPADRAFPVSTPPATRSCDGCRWPSRRPVTRQPDGPDPGRPGSRQLARARGPGLRRRRATDRPADRLPRTEPPGRQLGQCREQPFEATRRHHRSDRLVPTCGASERSSTALRAAHPDLLARRRRRRSGEGSAAQASIELPLDSISAAALATFGAGRRS